MRVNPKRVLSNLSARGRWRVLRRRLLSPFTAAVPPRVAGAMVRLQYQRVSAHLPWLCLLLGVHSLATALALRGNLPLWQQWGPAGLISAICLYVLIRNRRRNRAAAPLPRAQIYRHLRRASMMSAPVGLIAGLWAANAFTHASHQYCMVAPVFIAIAALTSASCLLGVPRAAIAGMVSAIAPIALKLALYDSLGMRALALMLVLMTVMQIHVVLAKFNETLAMLTQQHQAIRASLTDPLTGLANRLAFMRMLEDRLHRERPMMLVLADLDGLKQANDTHGHLAGDAILAEVAHRMQRLGARALCVARLGGDEFAMLYDISRGQHLALGEVAAVRAGLSLPIVWNGIIVPIGASFGTAIAPLEGADAAALIQSADCRLYADKAARKSAAPREVAQRVWRF